MTKGADRISPTAHYTGYVWYRNGLSYPALMTRRGRRLYYALQPAALIYSRGLGGPTLEQVLLRRHQVIDHLLGAAIERGEIGQVIEVAAGLSPRGTRLCQRFGSDLTYVEADLAGMAALKRRLLSSAGLLGKNHHVVSVDALADAGPHSLTAVVDDLLEPGRGTAIITEGLLNYLEADEVRRLWSRFAALLSRFPAGVYLSDLHVSDESNRRRAARLFRRLLELYSRGAVYLHFRDAVQASKALLDAGFAGATLHSPRSYEGTLAIPRLDEELVRVIEATSVTSVITVPSRAVH
jgi:O-methyltransferase involved in polyketide biosynthesis